MKVLCFGDSNTFGYIPGGAGRYDRYTRWPGQLQRLLGEQYQIIEEGLCGRTTVFEDTACPGRRGLDALIQALKLYGPLDLLIIMLGTNDCKTQFRASAGMISKGLEEVLEKAGALAAQPFRTLLISPAPLDEAAVFEDSEFDTASVAVSRGLAEEFKQLAQRYGCLFLDASAVAAVSKADGVHLDAAGHKALADAVGKLVQKI